MQVMSPHAEGARPYSLGMGQVLGLVAGLAAIHLAGAAGTPAFSTEHPLVTPRVAAAVVAIGLAAALQISCKATSAVGGATALVVALGTETADWAGAARMAVGIAVITALGDVARHVLMARRPSAPAD